MQPNQRPRTWRLDDMVRQLRDDITIHGKYAPGEFLPSELALVEAFGLSNKTVRKGLELLCGEGLIEKIPRVGSRVTAAATGAIRTVLRLGTLGSLERDIRLSALLERFSDENPDIELELIPFHADDYAAMMSAHLSAGLVDALMINDELFWQLCERDGDALPLEAQQPAEGTYSFLNGLFSHKGALYAQPLVFSPIVLAYNREHFRDSGVPEPDGSWTWEETLHWARQLAIPGERYGLCFYPLSNNRWPVFLLQSGERFPQAAEPPLHWEGSQLLSNLRLYKRIIRDRTIFPDHLAESSVDVVTLFQHGKVSMMLSTYNLLNGFALGGPEYDLSPAPYAGEPRTLLTTIGIGISRFSRHREAAHRLSAFLASGAAQQMIREQTLTIPAIKRAADKPAPGGDGLRRPARYYLYRNIVPSFRRYADLGLTPTAFYRLRELLKLYGSELIDERQMSEQLAALADWTSTQEVWQ